MLRLVVCLIVCVLFGLFACLFRFVCLNGWLAGCVAVAATGLTPT